MSSCTKTAAVTTKITSTVSACTKTATTRITTTVKSCTKTPPTALNPLALPTGAMTVPRVVETVYVTL
jgi:hypothetical protein